MKVGRRFSFEDFGEEVSITGDEREISILIALAYIMKVDFRVLLCLYEKYGIDVLYLFYMLAGKIVVFPRLDRLYRIIRMVDGILEGEKVQGKTAIAVQRLLSEWRDGTIKVKVKRDGGTILVPEDREDEDDKEGSD